MSKSSPKILEGNAAELEALKHMPSIDECHLSAISVIATLRRFAAQGDAKAIASLRNIGLFAALLLEELWIEEQNSGAESGPVKKVARKSLEWPQRLSAVKEIRTGKNARTAANAERYVAALELGSETDIQTERNPNGGSRNFQGKSGFVLRVLKTIREDVSRYSGLTDSQLMETRYWKWSYSTRQVGDDFIPLPKSPILHALFREYIKRARSLAADDAIGFADVAILWAKVDCEGDIEKPNVWPAAVEKVKQGDDATYESRLRKYFRSGFSAVKRSGV